MFADIPLSLGRVYGSTFHATESLVRTLFPLLNPTPYPVTSGVREQARQTKHASMWLLVISCESMCILKIMLRGWRCEGRLAAGWRVGGREGVGATVQGNAIARKKGQAN